MKKSYGGSDRAAGNGDRCTARPFTVLALSTAALILALLFVAAAPAAAADGKQVYEGKCESCHGKDGTGRGNLFDLPDLNEESLWRGNTQARLINTVKTGRGEMPGFDGMLSDEEIEAVLRYESREFGGVNWSEIEEGDPAMSENSTIAPGFGAPAALLGAAALLLARRLR